MPEDATWAGLVVLSVLLTAGCVDAANGSTGSTASSSTSNAPPLSASAAAPNAAATESLGALSVTVLTTELVPVSAAQVTISDLDRNEFTDEAGVATFNALEPGDYTVLTAKPGYRALQDKGRVVEISSGEVTETRLTLDPIPTFDAGSAYQVSLPFTGFIGCALEGWQGPGGIGYTTYCGRGVQTPAGHIKDPNDQTLFEVPIENIQIQSVVAEAAWQPNNPVTSPQVRLIWATGIQCGTGGSCLMTSNQKINVGGVSPLQGSYHEGSQANFSSRFPADAAAYPVSTYVEIRAYCDTNCTLLGVSFQQEVDIWASTFYGKPAPDGFSAFPE